MVWILSKRVEDVSLQQFLLSTFYSFDFIFLSIVWIDKLHMCWRNLFQYLTRKHKKETFWLFMVTVAKEEKLLHQQQDPQVGDNKITIK